MLKTASAQVMLIILLVLVSACTQSPPIALTLGTTAPDFSYPLATGGTFALARRENPLVLLSFVDVNAPAADQVPNPSRSQVVVLQSMSTQYADQGVDVVIAHGAVNNPATADSLVNFTYNWNLQNVAVLLDGGELARIYGVKELPSTFLISKEGAIVLMWQGYVPSQDIALALTQYLIR